MSFKRTFDIVFSFLALLVLLPILLLLYLLVKIKLGSPALFIQQRPGLDSKPFTLVKFRTMTDERCADGELLPDAQRLTPFGRFLRASSLDELPEFWNVLKGDMSLVGPRPLLVEYLPLYSPEQKRRHEVRPGITGWAQVNGRNAISWDKKFALDIWYVDNQSIALDARIIWMTFQRLIDRKDVNESAEITMTRFEGSESVSAGKKY